MAIRCDTVQKSTAKRQVKDLRTIRKQIALDPSATAREQCVALDLQSVGRRAHGNEIRDRSGLIPDPDLVVPSIADEIAVTDRVVFHAFRPLVLGMA